jgi:hypothetical protein
MQSPISKRHWYDGSKTKKNDVLENLNGQRWGSAIMQKKNCFIAVSLHARNKTNKPTS